MTVVVPLLRSRMRTAFHLAVPRFMSWLVPFCSCSVIFTRSSLLHNIMCSSGGGQYKGKVPAGARTDIKNPAVLGEGDVEPLRNPAGAVLVAFRELPRVRVVTGKGLIVQGRPPT